MRNKKREMWDFRGGPVAWIHVTLSFTHRISTTHMSNNINIISILVIGNNHVTGIHEYPYINNSFNMNRVQCNGNKETIITCIRVNLYNSEI